MQSTKQRKQISHVYIVKAVHCTREMVVNMNRVCRSILMYEVAIRQKLYTELGCVYSRKPQYLHDVYT